MKLSMSCGRRRQVLLLLALDTAVDAVRLRGDSLAPLHGPLADLQLPDGIDFSEGGVDDIAAVALLVHEVMSKVGGSNTPSGIKELIPLLMPILEAMEDAIDKTHNASQEEINRFPETFSECHPSSNSSLSVHWASYQKQLKVHSTCRADEYTLERNFSNCTQTKGHLKTNMDNKEQLFEHVNGPPNPGTDCESANEQKGKYLLRLKNFFTLAYQTWFSRKTQYEAAEKAYDSLGCSASQSSYMSKKGECDGVLRTVEDSACSYAQGMKMSCTVYHTCYGGKAGAYQAAIKSARKEETARKVQWRGIQRMKCVLLALGNGTANTADATALQACIAIPARNTDHLNLTYPVLPEKGFCNDPMEYPCTPAYNAAVYGSLPAVPHVPVCKPCVLPTPPGLCYETTSETVRDAWFDSNTPPFQACFENCPHLCKEKCAALGFKFFGLECAGHVNPGSIHCACYSHALPSNASRAPASDCRQGVPPCPGLLINGTHELTIDGYDVGSDKRQAVYPV